MLWVAWRRYCVEKLLEPRWAADVLRRRATVTIDEPGISANWIGGQNAFDYDAVPPVVSEIIGVGKGCDSALDELCEADVAGVVAWWVHIIVVEADAVAGLADIEANRW